MDNIGFNVHLFLRYRSAKICVIVVSGAIFLPSRKGKNNLLLYNSYTYSRGVFGNYYCSKRTVMKCKAKVKLDEINNIVLVEDGIHNHEPPVFHISSKGEYVPINFTCGIWTKLSTIKEPLIVKKQGPMFLTTRRNKRILLYQGFTYSRVNPGQYCCSKRLVLKCKAKIKLDEVHTVILDEELKHNHVPPVFHVSKDGEYIPIT
ncbi:uncharacterized protein LOC134749243 [Cydia strobilella]|uniref:uncharacterized protein LOC134749243 n=1 Tax=Cydia strobilella TaxID=1100964 RepID=UPI003004881B